MDDKMDASAQHVMEIPSADIPIKTESELAELASDVQHTKPRATTFAMFKLYAILSVGYFCIILQGYDGSLMGAINAMPQYLDYYNLFVMP